MGVTAVTLQVKLGREVGYWSVLGNLGKRKDGSDVDVKIDPLKVPGTTVTPPAQLPALWAHSTIPLHCIANCAEEDKVAFFKSGIGSIDHIVNVFAKANVPMPKWDSTVRQCSAVARRHSVVTLQTSLLVCHPRFWILGAGWLGLRESQRSLNAT
jgi:hypothetical protein